LDEILSENEKFKDVPGLKRIPVLIDKDFLISSAPVLSPTSGAFSNP
jgi:hypothetical protein